MVVRYAGAVSVARPVKSVQPSRGSEDKALNWCQKQLWSAVAWRKEQIRTQNDILHGQGAREQKQSIAPSDELLFLCQAFWLTIIP